jgi:hypothetical protein
MVNRGIFQDRGTIYGRPPDRSHDGSPGLLPTTELNQLHAVFGMKLTVGLANPR